MPSTQCVVQGSSDMRSWGQRGDYPCSRCWVGDVQPRGLLTPGARAIWSVHTSYLLPLPTYICFCVRTEPQLAADSTSLRWENWCFHPADNWKSAPPNSIQGEFGVPPPPESWGRNGVGIVLCWALLIPPGGWIKACLPETSGWWWAWEEGCGCSGTFFSCYCLPGVRGRIAKTNVCEGTLSWPLAIEQSLPEPLCRCLLQFQLGGFGSALTDRLGAGRNSGNSPLPCPQALSLPASPLSSSHHSGLPQLVCLLCPGQFISKQMGLFHLGRTRSLNLVI